MGLYFKQHKKGLTFGVWKIEESIKDLEILSCCKTPANLSNSVRISEYLSVRALTKQLGENPENIFYYSSGKPYLKERSYNISISHTKGYVAVLIANDKLSGIDIEAKSERVLKIKSKFISEIEEHNIENSEDKVRDLLLHWCSKEAIFKSTDSEGIDFKKELIIDRFNYSGEKGKFSGIFTRESQRFEINYINEKDFILVYCFSAESK